MASHEHEDAAGQVIEPDSGSDERDAEREARKHVALAQIRQYGDPVLRMRANEVLEFDEELARLTERMTGLMHDADGIGLAATQVGVVRRVFVFSVDGEDSVLVNPEIVERGDVTEIDDEGCLSLGPVRVPVERAVAVTIAGKNAAGQPVRYELECTAARVAQHELDHLDGVLMLDRTTNEARREAMATLRAQLSLA
jgi:peptide deformylase